MSESSRRYAEWSRSHDGARAERFARAALAADPRCAQARLALARALYRLDRFEEARGLVRGVIAEGRAPASAFEELADLYRAARVHPHDLWALAEAARHDPERTDLAQKLIGWTHCGVLQHWPGALARFDLQTAWNAVAFGGDERPDPVLRAIVLPTYERLLRVDPANLHYRFGRARALAQLGEHDAAAAAFRHILEERRDELRALQGLASALYCADRHGDAIPVYEMLVSVDGADPEAHRLLGEARAARGRWSEAAASYRRALDLLPTPEKEAELEESDWCGTGLEFDPAFDVWCPGREWKASAREVSAALARARSQDRPPDAPDRRGRPARASEAAHHSAPPGDLLDAPLPAFEPEPRRALPELERSAGFHRKRRNGLDLERALDAILELEPDRAELRRERDEIRRLHPLPRGGVRRSEGRKLVSIHGVVCVLHACSTAERYLDRGCPALREEAEPRARRGRAADYLQRQVATGRFETPEPLECPHCGAAEAVPRLLPNSGAIHRCSGCGAPCRAAAIQLTPPLETLLDLGTGPAGPGLAVIYLLMPEPDGRSAGAYEDGSWLADLPEEFTHLLARGRFDADAPVRWCDAPTAPPWWSMYRKLPL